MGSELDYESYAEDDMTDSEDEFHDCESDGQSLPPPKNEVNIFFLQLPAGTGQFSSNVLHNVCPNNVVEKTSIFSAEQCKKNVFYIQISEYQRRC